MRRSLRASSISILLTLLLGPWEAAVDGEPQQWNREANSDAVTIAPGQDIQSIVDAAPAGTQFRLVAGVHRLQQIKPRSFDRFEGEPGAVLNGARLLDDFGREGDLWTSAGPSRQRRQDGYCRQIREEEVYGGCRYPEDLYLDDEPLRRVEHRDHVVSGAWFFDDGAARLYLADDPRGRRVELGLAPYAFSGSARDVEIRGLTIEKYANPSQTGAVHAAEPGGRLASGWIVADNHIRLNHGAGLLVGDSMTVRSNRVVRNGQIGLLGGGAGSQIEDNEVARNNYAGFDPGWEAGGAKFFLSRDLIVRDNYVHDNDGPGLWTDIDNVDVIYEGNVVVDNAYQGIHHEISFGAVIRRNVVERNGLAFDEWLWGAQILIQNSSGAEVYCNRVFVDATGGDGIALIQQDRGAGSRGPYRTRENLVHHNDVVYLGNHGESGAVADHREAEMLRANRFDSNVYHVADPRSAHWAWGNSMTWAEFRAAGQEAAGTSESSGRQLPTSSPQVRGSRGPRVAREP